jgi:hypothetical protein
VRLLNTCTVKTNVLFTRMSLLITMYFAHLDAIVSGNDQKICSQNVIASGNCHVFCLLAPIAGEGPDIYI